MDQIIEPEESILQIHAFLDKESICIRSYVDGETPYFEVDLPYDNSQSFLAALSDEEMDERLFPLFSGVKIDLNKSKIFCNIDDYRAQTESHKSFVFKNKCKENNTKMVAYPNENHNPNE